MRAPQRGSAHPVRVRRHWSAISSFNNQQEPELVPLTTRGQLGRLAGKSNSHHISSETITLTTNTSQSPAAINVQTPSDEWRSRRSGSAEI